MNSKYKTSINDALYCINFMKKEGTYHGERIGVVRNKICGMCEDYEKGEIVLFRHSQFIESDVTIERPLTKEELEKSRSEGSRFTAVGTVVGAPRNRIVEIKYPKQLLEFLVH